MWSNRLYHLVPGLLLCAVIAALSVGLGNFSIFASHGLSALTLAILIGIVVGNFGYQRIQDSCGVGVGMSKHHLLRAGIILYGFRLTLQDISNVGMHGILSDTLVLLSTFFLAIVIGVHIFKLHRDSAILIGAGSSICGAAAIMATDGVLEAKSERVSVAVSTVVVFGSLAILLYPLLYQLNLDWNLISTNAKAFGVYTGSTIHEVAQVVAAGKNINQEVADVAVITKMVRVMMLAPFLLILPFWLSQRNAEKQSNAQGKKSKLMIPWFAFIFVGVTLFNSLHLLPQALVNVLLQIDTALLAMAMAGLGLTTHWSAIRKAGVKPLLLALILFVWLILGGAIINKIVFSL